MKTNMGEVATDTSSEQELFFQEEQRIISDYAVGLPITFKPGEGWAVNPESGDAIYDPNFFTEKGYSRSQSLFATLHEIDHVVEAHELLKTTEGKEVHEQRKEERKNKRRIKELDNCLLDVADNRRVLDKAPSLEDETSRLYKEKLWPSQDLSSEPRHLQFAHTILREAMLPDEEVQVAPEVREAINKLKKVEGKSGKPHNLIEIVTDPKREPVSKFKLIKKYIDPVYEELFEKDVDDKKRDGSSSDNPENYFSDQYDKSEEKSPHVLDGDEIEQAATSGGVGGDVDDRQDAGYEKEHGVDLKDLAEYKTEYKKIEKFIEPLREQFRKIVEERLIPKRKLKGIRDEGVIIEPGLAAVAQAEFDRGVPDPFVFRDFEGRVTKEEVPSAFEITGVFDRSGSMESGDKKEEQRRAAILLMESLQEFMEQPEVIDQRIDPDMYATSEIRSFGGSNENVLIKPPDSQLSEKQRVEVFKTLGNCPGSSTQDYVVLGQILDDMEEKERQEPGYLEKIKQRKLNKIVAIFSDGASSNEAEYDKKKKKLEEYGVRVVDYRKIRDNVEFVPTMAKLLEEALKDLRYNKGQDKHE